MNEPASGLSTPALDGNEFFYSRWGKVAAFLDVSFSLVFGCAFLWIATYALGLPPSLELLAGVPVMYYGAVIAFCRVYLRIKYRHVLGVRYRVGDSGVSVDADGQRQLVPWGAIAKAQYLPLIPLYRLWAASQAQPIVLFMIGDMGPTAANRRNKLAGAMLKDKLGQRLEKHWLPW